MKKLALLAIFALFAGSTVQAQDKMTLRIGHIRDTTTPPMSRRSSSRISSKRPPRAGSK